MSEQMDEVFGKLLEWLEATESFAQEQVPILLQEILAWKMASATAVLTISFGCMAAYFTMLIKAEKPLIRNQCDAVGVLTIVGILTTLISAIVFLVHLFTVLQIHFAPRVYLIEYMRGLL